MTTPTPPVDLTHHFSRVTAARKPSGTKEFYQYFDVPNIGNLSAGFPNASFFPFKTLEGQITRPERFPLRDPPCNRSEGYASIRLTIPHEAEGEKEEEKIDVTTALQYTTADGYPPLYSFLRQFTREILQPNVPYLNGPEIILTCGNTDAFAQVIEAFTNEWNKDHDVVREREAILCEQFTYMHAIQSVKPRGIQVVPVTMDAEGMLPSGPKGLEDLLANWDESKGKRPHLLYTIPVGQNPTGAILSTERRREIYGICRKYDVVIIEDDPYWYLQFPSAATLEASSRGLPPPTAPPAPPSNTNVSGFPFIDSLVPSYLNIDTDGRVVRLDTFSKMIAPGCRLGWITAQPVIIQSILRITETSTAQPSGFVQAMVAQLLMSWKVDGWMHWLDGLRKSYESRMNSMCSIIEGQDDLVSSDNKNNIYSFDWPRGGMSVWVRIHFETHPLADQIPGPNLAHFFWLFLMQRPHLILVTPGHMFSPTDEVAEEHGWKYIRLCFAAVSTEMVEQCSKRFVRATREFWAIDGVQELEEIHVDI
ncbi:hypothetical protein N7499_008940 [Penicillium canescens]|nr:hypothetical protein N7499_008940 [Penicillium canescens]